MFAVVELGWIILGTVWLMQGKLSCPAALDEERLILGKIRNLNFSTATKFVVFICHLRFSVCYFVGFIISSWILLLTILFLTYIIFDAFGAHNFEIGREGPDPVLSKAWNRRLKSCLDFKFTKDETEQDSLRELSGENYNRLSKKFCSQNN